MMSDDGLAPIEIERRNNILKQQAELRKLGLSDPRKPKAPRRKKKLPDETLPNVINRLREQFPGVDWPDLPDIRLHEVPLPDMSISELRHEYPDLNWSKQPKFSFADIVVILREAFSDRLWPAMPDVSLEKWDWPELFQGAQFLRYNGLMGETTQYEGLRAQFLNMLPFCAWKHLSETPTCLPVPCSESLLHLKCAIVHLYVFDDNKEFERVTFDQYAQIKEDDDTRLAGFVLVDGDINDDTAKSQSTKLLKQYTNIVYSGAVTAYLHAQIILDVLHDFEKIDKVWLHYDKYLFEALDAATSSPAEDPPDIAKANLVNQMRFVCTGKEHKGGGGAESDVNIRTTVKQEVQNLKAMHRQLATSFEMPMPVQVFDPEHVNSTSETRAAFNEPQFVRPVVQRSESGDLAIYYTNLQPIDASLPDVRIASPSARWKNWNTDETPDKMMSYVYTPGGFRAPHINLRNGDVIKAEIDRRTTLPMPIPVEWTVLQDERFCDMSDSTDAVKRTIRYVDPDVLSQKTISAYAKRVTSITTGVSDQMWCQCNYATPPVSLTKSCWTTQDNIEDAMWKERIGSLVDRPPEQENAIPYLVGIPSTYHFYKILYIEHENDIYILPFHNYLMLKDYMGTCVRLHGTPEEDEFHGMCYKIIKFEKDFDEALWNKFKRFVGDKNTIQDDDEDFKSKKTSDEIYSKIKPSVRNQWKAEMENAIHGFFSESLPSCKVDDMHGWTDGIYMCEKHIRRLFYEQMRRTLQKCKISPDTINHFLSKFDIDACFPAMDEHKQTVFGYVICEPWPLGEKPGEERAVMNFREDTWYDLDSDNLEWEGSDGMEARQAQLQNKLFNKNQWQNSLYQIEWDKMTAEQKKIAKKLGYTRHIWKTRRAGGKFGMDLNKNVDFMDYDEEGTLKLPRYPFITMLSDVDKANFEKFIKGKSKSGDDPLALKIDDDALYIGFSPIHTQMPGPNKNKKISFVDVSINDNSNNGIMFRFDLQTQKTPYVYPYNYYANGSLFLNNISNLTSYRDDPCETTLIEAIPNLRILRAFHVKTGLNSDSLYLKWLKSNAADCRDKDENGDEEEWPEIEGVNKTKLVRLLNKNLEISLENLQSVITTTEPNFSIYHVLRSGTTCYRPDLSFERTMIAMIDNIYKNALAFDISVYSKSNTMFALEVYDTMASLRSVMLVTDLARSIANSNVTNMKINAFELKAFFDNDGGDLIKRFEVDDVLKKMGCEDEYTGKINRLAMKQVLKKMCARNGNVCLVKTESISSLESNGIKFWGPPYYVSKEDNNMMMGCDQSGQRQVLSMHKSKRDWTKFTKKTFNYNEIYHSAIPNDWTFEKRGVTYHFCLFATPPVFASVKHRATVLVKPELAKIGVGTYQIESVVLRDGVCDLQFQSGDLITVERDPSFASLRETSIDLASVASLDVAVVDHGPPLTRCATNRRNIRVESLVSRMNILDMRPACRVRFAQIDEMVEYLQSSSTHMIILSVKSDQGWHGIKKTSSVELMAGADPSYEPCLEAIKSRLTGGVFPKDTALDRRILFAGFSDDGSLQMENVCDVVLLHVSTSGVVNEFERLREITQHPGSYICTDGPTLYYGFDPHIAKTAHTDNIWIRHDSFKTPEPALPGNYRDAITSIVYLNCIVGDSWVLSAPLDPPETLESIPITTAVDGRSWNGENTVAWNARMIQLNDNGTIGWNSGYTPYLIESSILGDEKVHYHGSPNAFVLLTPPTILSRELQHFQGSEQESTDIHVRTTLSTPFSMQPETEKISLFVTPNYNVTLFVYFLLPLSTRSDLILAHDVRTALDATAIGVNAFDVTVTTTPLTTSTLGTSHIDQFTQTKPIIYDRESSDVLVPGKGTKCMLEVRFGTYLEDERVAEIFRTECVEKIKYIFGVGSVASLMVNCYEGYAVTLLNRRVEETIRRTVIGTSDIGRDITILKGRLTVDNVDRPASWSISPADIPHGTIESVYGDTDATVVVRVDAHRSIVISNPAPVYRARPDTLSNFYAAAMRITLEHYRD
jgi:hypothetical protein